MGLPVKTLSRNEWKGDFRKESSRIAVGGGFFEGHVGLIRFGDVKTPLSASLDGKTYDIIANGVCWLQLAPKLEKWWLTALYDAKGALRQFYFDITDGSFIDENGEPSFYDLMLDVVALPDGGIYVLDRDELDRALEERFITPEQHSRALSEGDRLVSWLRENLKALAAFCDAYFEKLLAEL
jgi:hypothetical protein